MSDPRFSPASIPDDALGATVIFEDDCVWGYCPRQNRAGVIEAIRNSRRDGRYFTLVVPGFNLPKTIRENQIVAYCHPSIMETTEESVVTADSSAA